jgi:hypothetical protein
MVAFAASDPIRNVSREWLYALNKQLVCACSAILTLIAARTATE